MLRSAAWLFVDDGEHVIFTIFEDDRIAAPSEFTRLKEAVHIGFVAVDKWPVKNIIEYWSVDIRRVHIADDNAATWDDDVVHVV